VELALEAKKAVSTAGAKIGPKAWKNWCRWAEMIRKNGAAMFVPYACIHKGGFGGADAIGKLLEPFTADICHAVEEESVAAKLEELMVSSQKTVDELTQRIAALGVEAKKREEPGRLPTVEKVEAGSKEHKVDDGLNDIPEKEVESVPAQREAGFLEKAGLPPLIVIKLRKKADADGSGSKQPRAERDIVENQDVAFDSQSKTSMQRTCVLEWTQETLRLLKQVGKPGNDEIIDLGVTLVKTWLPQSVSLVSSLNLGALRRGLERKDLPAFVKDLLKAKLVVFPVHLPQSVVQGGHFVAVCIMNIDSDCPQICIYDDANLKRFHPSIAKDVRLLVEGIRGKSVGTLWKSVAVSQQMGGSMECWLSAIINIGIIAAFEKTDGDLFLYGDETRKCMRGCLIAIAELQRREKNDLVDAIPRYLMDAFKNCILGAVAAVGVGVGEGEQNVENVEVQPVLDVVQPKQEEEGEPLVEGRESDPKRAKMSMDQGKGEEPMEEQLPAQPLVQKEPLDVANLDELLLEQQDGTESYQKRRKTFVAVAEKGEAADVGPKRVDLEEQNQVQLHTVDDKETEQKRSKRNPIEEGDPILEGLSEQLIALEAERFEEWYLM